MSSSRLPKLENHLRLDGCLLVASGQHPQPESSHSVFMVVHHRPEGTVGMLLNRTLSLDAKPIWNQILGAKAHQMPDAPVFYGGPLAGPVIALHDQREFAEAETAPGIYVAIQVDTLQRMSKLSSEHFRWYVGRACWGSGELEKQIAAGWWHVVPSTPDLVFAEDDEMWGMGVRTAGNLVIQHLSGAKFVPPQIEWN